MGEYLGVISIVGQEFSTKSTMALTAPRPIRHFDMDVGGFERAIHRIEKNNPGVKVLHPDDTANKKFRDMKLDEFDIVCKSFPRPVQIDQLKGITGDGSVSIRVPKRVTGMIELWTEMIDDFVECCTNQKVSSIIFDTWTLTWNNCHTSHLQGLQERQIAQAKSASRPMDENQFRERLGTMEYGPPNDRMRQLIQTARSYRKNLILVMYPRPVYARVPNQKTGEYEEVPTGEWEPDGFKETTKESDVVVWTSVKEKTDYVNGNKVVTRTPIARFTKCALPGMGLDALGMEVTANIQDVINLRNMMRGG